MAKFKHLTFEDRCRIETLYNYGHSKKEIAAFLRVNLSTIYRELKRGQYSGLTTEYVEVYKYSADIAQQRHDFEATAKGAPIKMGSCYALEEYIQRLIVEFKCSPAVVSSILKYMPLPALPYLSEGTIYRYIDHGFFSRITNADLPEKLIRKKKYKKVRTVRRSRHEYGTSIEDRPARILDRAEVGHWEMDSVIGKSSGKGESLLVLTERKTNLELIFKMCDKSAASVVRALDQLQALCGFRSIFKTITVDNGSEFSDFFRLQHSEAGQLRTRVYYCHPYTSCERGSNERANRLVRRWVPKGQSMKRVTASDAHRIQTWMNHYPRQSLEWKTPLQAFVEACEAENIHLSKKFLAFLQY